MQRWHGLTRPRLLAIVWSVSERKMSRELTPDLFQIQQQDLFGLVTMTWSTVSLLFVTVTGFPVVVSQRSAPSVVMATAGITTAPNLCIKSTRNGKRSILYNNCFPTISRNNIKTLCLLKGLCFFLWEGLCSASRYLAVRDVVAVLGEGRGGDDEAASALQVQGDALEAWGAEHVAVG